MAEPLQAETTYFKHKAGLILKSSHEETKDVEAVHRHPLLGCTPNDFEIEEELRCSDDDEELLYDDKSDVHLESDSD